MRRTTGFTAPCSRDGTLAILWDTGQGKQDLAAYVAQRVSTPCLVFNSHGHSDHVGGNFRFPVAYVHPLDWPLLAARPG